MLRYTLLLAILLAACMDTTPVEERPTFSISLASSVVSIDCDVPVDLVVTVDRPEGFSEPIEVGVMGAGYIDQYAEIDIDAVTIAPDATNGTLTFRASKTYTPEEVDVAVFARSTFHFVEEPLTIDLLCEEDPFLSKNDFLDSNFGDNGVALTSFAGNAYIYDSAVDTSGKIVVAGSVYTLLEDDNLEDGSDFALARYNPDGSPDTSFGSGGKVVTNFGDSRETAHALFISDSNKLVVAGSSSSTFILARYNMNGSLDKDFGEEGSVIYELENSIDTLAIDADGKVVVATEYALLRFNADGSLDTSFEVSGPPKSIYTVEALAFDQDDKIIIAGQRDGNFAVARYNPDGSLDTAFGDNGTATADFGGDDFAYALTVDRTGKIAVGGYTTNNVDFAVARYNADGTLDTSFGEGGKVTTDFNSYGVIYALALDKDENLVATGYNDANFGVARYQPDGSLDTSFGNNGLVADLFYYARSASANAVSFTADGKIVLTGYAEVQKDSEFAVARVLSKSVGGDE